MAVKKKREPLGPAYARVVAADAVNEFGTTVTVFRTLSEIIQSNCEGTELSREEMGQVDVIYQAYFDRVLDAVVGCWEMKTIDECMRAVRSMLNVRRGMVKTVPDG